MKLAPLLLVLVSVTQAAAGTSQPVLLDFHADWCGPCRQMRPAVQKLADAGYPIKSVDIDKSPETAEKYGVTKVPTFIVVDADGRELDRNIGGLPASQLGQFYIDAREKAKASARSRGDDESDTTEAAEDDAAAKTDDEPQAKPERERPASKPAPNPKPWETVVRIKVHANGSIGYGSGTIIHSSPKESLILTCAHIFKLDGQRQAPPNKFPRQITIDLFDGRPQGREAQVHPIETVAGEAIDYDFGLDVGLIRIRPGRRLPASRVVPPHWEPLKRMGMMTVGCSEGHDATAWKTQIIDPKMRGLSGNAAYEAIECVRAPLQGRSGGGLYTNDGYIAGVCNFAEPRGNRGLYATPNSIYSILDRNKLAGLYAPVSVGSTLMADRGGSSPMTIARGQSPDREEPVRAAAKEGDVTIPDPEIVIGMKAPLHGERNSRVQAASSIGDRRWASHSRGGNSTPKLASIETIEPTDIGMDAATDNDHFPPPDWDREDDEEERESNASLNTEDVAPKSESRKPVAGKAPGWRPAKSSSVGSR